MESIEAIVSVVTTGLDALVLNVHVDFMLEETEKERNCKTDSCPFFMPEDV